MGDLCLHQPAKYWSGCENFFEETIEKTTTSNVYFHIVYSLVTYRWICGTVCGAVFRGRKVSAHGYHGHSASNHGYQPEDDVYLQTGRKVTELHNNY